jgi:hypothetical protein
MASNFDINPRECSGVSHLAVDNPMFLSLGKTKRGDRRKAGDGKPGTKAGKPGTDGTFPYSYQPRPNLPVARGNNPMNKHLQLPVDIQLKDHAGQKALLMSFRQGALNDWCLGLCLLQAGLIDSLVVTEEHRKVRVEIRVGAKSEIDRTARATFTPDASQIQLTANGLDYLQHFFLKYYRDGAAEVDHLDLEAINADTGQKDFYVTFKVPDFVPPASSEEAEDRLRHL